MFLIFFYIFGGLDLLFGKTKVHNIELKDKSKITASELLVHMKENMIKERVELFYSNNNVRPGILVLINDTDWELLGGLNAEIEDKDTIVFISTLHGG